MQQGKFLPMLRTKQHYINKWSPPKSKKAKEKRFMSEVIDIPALPRLSSAGKMDWGGIQILLICPLMTSTQELHKSHGR